MRACAQVVKASANLGCSARFADGDDAPLGACKWADHLSKPPHTAKPGRRQPRAIAIQRTEHQEPVRLGRGPQSQEVRRCEAPDLCSGHWRNTLGPVREGQEREAHQGGGHKDCHIHAEDGSGAQGKKTESRMRGCGAGRNISRARSSRSINSALCDYFSRRAPHTPLLLDIFPFVGIQTATVSTPPPHAMVGGSLVVVKATASTSTNLESPTLIMWPPHTPNPTTQGTSPTFTNTHTPNYDEHELHRRLRSEKASNRSFLRRHGNGREGLSHFGNAPHMHTCAQHTQTQTHGNWRCWRRPDSTVSKLGLDIPLKGGKGHSRWTSDRIFS